MSAPLTRRKLLSLPPSLRHRKCAETLRALYEEGLETGNLPNLSPYHQLLDWMGQEPPPISHIKELSDHYHDHLAEAGRHLKEHNLLPSLRKGDHLPKKEFLPIAIYLDHLRSAYNVGSILRTAEALRIGSVHFSPKTPFLDNEKLVRTAMGAAPLVPCFQHTPLEELPRPWIGLDPSEEALPVHEYLFPATFTLILGNEEYGISEEILHKLDLLLEIPLLGAKNSLNVACAFAISAAEIRKQFP